MSYEKTTWTKGDTITAEKLNNMEAGIEAAVAGAGISDGISYDEYVENYDRLKKATVYSTRQTVLANSFNSFNYLEEVVLPDDLISVAQAAFYGCTALHTINFPSGLRYVGNTAFRGCSALQEVQIGGDAPTLENGAFMECTNLQKVTFSGALTRSDQFDVVSASISSTAFSNCDNLKDIYVPWAEGAVANAPWGATNATVHYDYTGE